MKNLKIYLLILVTGIMVFTNCSDDFLDSKPVTTLTDANFYQTLEDAELAIVGCYDGVQAINQEGVAFPVASEVFSDNCFGGTGNNDGYGYQLLDEFDLQRSPSDQNLFEENWINYYEAIYRVNMLLTKMDQIDWEGDTATMHSIEAEARFLRAFCYFDMVRLWEKVPLVTVPTEENVPQNEPDEIYAQITNDLLIAIEKGKETVEAGRVNKWAAKSLLGRVFLFYTGYYNKSDLVGLVSASEALAHLEDVIASGNYGLVEEFKNLWPAASATPDPENNTLISTYAGKDNQETIFAIKHNITSNYDGDTDGNHWLVMLGLREQAFSPYGRGWGACPVDPNLYNAFEEGDERKTASIIAIDEEGLDFDNSGQREYTGYANKKYIPLALPDGSDMAVQNGGFNFMIGQYQDYVCIRYADVLLMAAELGSPNAQDYMDQVRERAGLDPKPATKANILEERRFEFAFEGIRYWDLLRQGVETAANTIARSTTVLNGGVEAQKVIDPQNIIDTRGLQMIPQNQISLSDNVLKQNDGWN
ncbi:RagB/SusD family nutrient uptake outer membrane protein [Thermophagus xiamenensis]|uniref:Starch-binding associating with outer membrane n=1 Tax=Thermophagus xiamenensis TaxID=385682 RepID=A0A1I1VD53_9BACT|nr:RagB/SusD family nutrient uptake outer membrane protein [Thermophagus xiamenensis]SFD78370.1 Starch-binding associating with outer membrane [Thermophagus xiamenensis]